MAATVRNLRSKLRAQARRKARKKPKKKKNWALARKLLKNYSLEE